MKIETEVIRDDRDIKKFFKEEEENYYKLVRVSNLWSKNYIEHETNGDKTI